MSADRTGRTAAEWKIEQALVKDATFQFDNAPLEYVADQLSKKYQLHIVLDYKQLEELGLSSDTDTQVYIDAKNIRLESALALFLDPLGLTYVVSNESLLFTSQQKAKEMLETRVYPVGSEGHATFQMLQKLFPEQWSSTGKGHGELALVGETLVIRTDYAMHKKINDLFLTLSPGAPKPDSGATSPPGNRGANPFGD